MHSRARSSRLQLNVMASLSQFSLTDTAFYILFYHVSPTFICWEGFVSRLLNLKLVSSPGPNIFPNVYFPLRWVTSSSSGNYLPHILPFRWCTPFVANARVDPLFKTGDSAIHTNYRPLSFISSCCKIMDHIILNYLADFLVRPMFHSILARFP